ncbi:MAG: class I SAM-dependent methyltransferase [Mycobacterium leprae]
MSDQPRKGPEEMAAFFDARADGYDDHMRECLGSLFTPFYSALATAVTPTTDEIEILDLGAGTGAEITGLLGRAPNAAFTCIDLSGGMLAKLRERYESQTRRLTLVQGSYLNSRLEAAHYHYVVSAMTLHHLPPDAKCVLYTRIRSALKAGGKYVEGDYYASLRDEAANLARFQETMSEAGDDQLYHVDVCLSLDTQRELLLRAGFARVTVAWRQNDKAVLIGVK